MNRDRKLSVSIEIMKMPGGVPSPSRLCRSKKAACSWSRKNRAVFGRKRWNACCDIESRPSNRTFRAGCSLCTTSRALDCPAPWMGKCRSEGLKPANIPEKGGWDLSSLCLHVTCIRWPGTSCPLDNSCTWFDWISKSLFHSIHKQFNHALRNTHIIS